jgi:hypothetical protein
MRWQPPAAVLDLKHCQKDGLEAVFSSPQMSLSQNAVKNKSATGHEELRAKVAGGQSEL